ncbi:hypothetical protein H8M21_23575 [Klebsiella pneumoniae]|nr:hypothetical protein [Klebsiella pneumoniae]HBQ2852495.1 hypothetical protein [Klebsiella pneumoniae]
MVRTPPSPPTMRPEPFNPDAEYPPFDKNATEDIDGKKIKLLASPLDTAYLYDVPEKMINLSTLSPDDHRIRDAITHNIALKLVETLRPGWPHRVIEWLVIPDIIRRTRKELLITETYLAESLSASPERKAALFRVVRALSPQRISHMSQDAQNTVYNVLQQMASAPLSDER